MQKKFLIDKEYAKSVGIPSLIIPEKVKILQSLFPKLICNTVSSAVEKAVLQKDYHALRGLILSEGLANGKVRMFLKKLEMREKVLVHYYKDDESIFMTSIIEIGHNEFIPCAPSDIVVITKVPRHCIFPLRDFPDDSQRLLINLLEKIFT